MKRLLRIFTFAFAMTLSAPIALPLLTGAVGFMSGCSYIHKTVPIHPGAISNLDSYAYDLLLVEQAAINQARAQYLGGTLPPTAKKPLNAAIDQYNITMSAWKSYHASGQGQDELQQALGALVGAVGELEKALQHEPSNVPSTTGWIPQGELAWA